MRRNKKLTTTAQYSKESKDKQIFKMRLGLKIHVVCALEGEIYWRIDNIRRNSKVFAPQSIKKNRTLWRAVRHPTDAICQFCTPNVRFGVREGKKTYCHTLSVRYNVC